VSFQEVIVTGYDGPPSYEWLVPGPVADSCKIRIDAYGGTDTFSDVSHGLFAIVSPGGIVPELIPGAPMISGLRAIAPNPFHSSAAITYDISQSAVVRICVYDVAGRTVRVLLSAWHEAGSYQAVWNGRADDGRLASSGVYLCTSRINGQALPPHRMMLLR